MLTVRSDRSGDVWFAVAENERGEIVSSSFSLNSRREAVQSVVKSLPVCLKREIKEKKGKSSSLQMMRSLFQGKRLSKQRRLDMRFIPPFTRAVYRTARNIPRGWVTTYGIIAAKAGNRFAQRAVGNAMRRNPFTLFVPCHRVVPSTLNVGRYSLSSYPHLGSKVKRALLVGEGVDFDGKKVSRKSVWKFKSRR